MTLVVTDHAVLRYLERIAGMEVEQLRAALATRLARMEAIAAVADLPGRHVIRTEDAKFVVVNGHVVTVLSPNAVTLQDDHGLRRRFSDDPR